MIKKIFNFVILQEKVIIEHFASIADAIPIPLIVYNNPFATSIDINLNTIKILSDHPNICGIKDTDVRFSTQ